MTNGKENIGLDQKALKVRGDFTKARLQQKIAPKVSTNAIKGASLPLENLTPEQQPGAAQLMRKLQNRMRRRTAEQAGFKRATPAGIKIGAGTGGIETTLPFPQTFPKEEERTGEVVSGEEDETQRELENLRRMARKNQIPEAKGKELNMLKREASRLRLTIWKHKAKMPMLLGVLMIALVKDVLDILGEFVTIGIWSWVDWIIDLFLGVSAYLLGIEKDSKDRMIGWGFVVLEIIPYVGLLPSWTFRVARAMSKSFKKIRTSNKSLRNIERKQQALQTKKSA